MSATEASGPGHEVAITFQRKCDCCGAPAKYDAKIPGMMWANLCQEDFDRFGCTTGVGKGQRLILIPSEGK